MKSTLTNIQKKFESLTKCILPPSLQIEYERIQISNNIYRFKIICIIVFIISFLSFIYHFRLNVNAAIDQQTIYLLFIIVSGVFFVVFSNLHKIINSVKLKWLVCYGYVVLVSSIQFLSIINVTLSQQPTFPYIILINLLVVVPDFKPIYTILLIVAIYIGSMFVQLFYLPVTSFAIVKIVNISVFTLICIATNIFLYTKNTRVYLDEIQLKEANEHLSLISTIDELTGLPNRRAFNYFFDNLYIHCKLHKLPICIVMIDIDYFKNTMIF